jgi:hypothetical protein
MIPAIGKPGVKVWRMPWLTENITIQHI